MKVRLPLLSLGENGRLKDIEHPFSIAPSGQFREPVFQRQGNVIHVNYNSSSGEIFSGKMGAADLMFDWEWLRHKDPERVADGYIGPAFLKVSFDLSSQLPEGWTGKRPKMVNYFLSAKGNNKHQSEVTAGLRILSVDMGVRSFASCSVFELCKESINSGALSFKTDCDGLWAVHERSFILRLPDEELDRNRLEWRRNQRNELRQLRQGLSRYRKLYVLDKLESEQDRREALETFSTQLSEVEGWPFENSLIANISWVS